jgi:hypothetical protein
MNCYIKETKQIKTLELISAQTQCDFLADLMGNYGALNDGQFVFDAERDAYICAQETFKWWDNVIDEHQELEYRIHELIQEHGRDAVLEVIEDAGDGDLESHASRMNRALTHTFGE